MHLKFMGAFIMASERNYSPTIPIPEASRPQEVRAIRVDEVDTNLPLILTIGYGAIRMPYSQPEESISPVNSMVTRNPHLIDYLIEQHRPDLIVLNPDSTTKTVGELAKSAPVVVVIDRNSPAVERVEEMYSEGAEVVLDRATDPRILNAAVNDVLRRSLAHQDANSFLGLNTGNPEEASQEKPIMIIGGLEVNNGKAEIKYNGEVVDLAVNERKMLFLLIENIDTVVSRQTIAEYVWEHPFDEHLDSSLRVLTHKLRNKIPGFIKTKPNFGLIFVTPKDLSSEDAIPGEEKGYKKRSFHLLSSQTSKGV